MLPGKKGTRTSTQIKKKIGYMTGNGPSRSVKRIQRGEYKGTALVLDVLSVYRGICPNDYHKISNKVNNNLRYQVDWLEGMGK